MHRALICIIYTCTCRLYAAELVAAAVIPHGDFAYDPSLLNDSSQQAAAQRIHNASCQAGMFIRETRPDIIFLSTPHGLELTGDFLLYENPVLSGVATLGADVGPGAPSYNVSKTLRTDPVVTDLLKRLRSTGANVTGIRGFGMGLSLPISWGEVLPLSFLDVAGPEPNDGYKVIVMGIPYRRYTEDFTMVQELTTLGAAIAMFFAELPQRVAWIVSSDLAHTHRADGPYGFSSAAAPFDDAVGRWMRTLVDAHLEEATKLEQAGAKSCGYTGLVMLNGALAALGGPAAWRSSLLGLEAPTYYGMGVATFEQRLPRAGVVLV